MSNTKHTPGPWTLNEQATDTWVYDSNADGLIARVVTNKAQTQQADARLIAAAPDLLEALLACLDRLQSGDEAVAEKARAAIVKAGAL